jgi:hypothetical protein
MSDTADDIGFNARRVLDKSKTDPLRQRMREFVSDRQAHDVKELRAKVADGTDLSEIVDQDRDERV